MYTQAVVEYVAMATNDTPVLDELCLSLLFDLLHSLDGAHCEGSRDRKGSREGEHREGAEIARAAESGSKEGEQGVGAEIARYVQTENSQLL